jgi:hypothetical protein
MWADKLKVIDETGWLLIAIVGVVIIYEVLKPKDPNGQPSAVARALGVPDPTDTTGDPNSLGDTSSAAYAGAGVFGWLGNVTNQAFGGTLQSLGNSIGGAVADATGN